LIFALARGQPALHRLLRGQERVGDLLGLQAADRAQGQGNLGLGIQRGVTAAEDQLQALVLDSDVLKLVHVILGRFTDLQLAGLLGQRALPPDPVDRPVARRDREPCSGVGRHPGTWPALSGDGERVLAGLLGELEVAEEADQVSKHAGPLVAEDLIEQRYRSTIGRTSTDPPSRADGILAANASAASRSGTSIR
jgi:hypothetical protein